jgi:hypothetical protein
MVALVWGCGGSDESGLPVEPSGGAGGGGATAGAGGQAASAGAAGAGASTDGGKDVSAEGSAGKAGADGGGGTSGAGGAGGGAAGAAGTAASAGFSGGAGTAGAGGCAVNTCQGHTYECGDCLDNDSDGLVDMADPDCLGPCHNNERGYDPKIPGGSGPQGNCLVDCYYDQDTGSGNDQCNWNHECDPLEVAPDYFPDKDCKYDPNAKTPGTNKTCSELLAAQSAECLAFCGPLTPNGCDCFGCCELPSGSGKFVFLGSVANKVGTCDLDHVGDPTKCYPCTPVPGCFNDCKHCELCLGKTQLPPDCYPPPPDGGSAGTGGSGGSGTGGTGGTAGGGTGGGASGTGGSAGSGGACGGQICPPGAQPCGLSCQPPCPTGYFCLTGCCQKSPA